MNTPGNQQRATDRFAKIVQVLSDNNVPATGFVIAGAIEKGQWAFLEQFRKAGLEIGNHTYSHRSLNQMKAEAYIADVEKADKVLAPLMKEPKYFRYPYLAEGNKESKPIVLEFLLLIITQLLQLQLIVKISASTNNFIMFHIELESTISVR